MGFTLSRGEVDAKSAMVAATTMRMFWVSILKDLVEVRQSERGFGLKGEAGWVETW